MTLLFCDVETSGLLKKSMPLESAEQPWCVSIAAELCDDAGNQIACLSTAIRANGRTITEGARRVHGVSSAAAGRTGVSELAALGILCGKESFASQARFVIGHGLDFDRQIIESLLLRHNREATTWIRPGLQFVDTMKAAAPFCRLPSDHESGSYKWPSLSEALSLLLGEPPLTNAHNAWADLQGAKRLFFWLRDKGAFDIEAAV